jgi:hypothetical protein
MENQFPDEAPRILASFHAYDLSEIETYSHASGYASILWDLKQELRKWVKYGHDFKTADEALEKTKELLYSLCNDRHIPQD